MARPEPLAALPDLEYLSAHLLADKRRVDHRICEHRQVRPVLGAAHEEVTTVKAHHHLLDVTLPGHPNSFLRSGRVNAGRRMLPQPFGFLHAGLL
jgi:hypothetical protein